jgi:hypothetical protein
METQFKWSWAPKLNCYRLTGSNNLICLFTTRLTDLSRLTSQDKLKRVVRLHQIHSDRVFYIRGLKTDLKGDGLYTDQAGIFLSVKVADCLPIYFFDPNLTSVGICHAGWRGTAAGIARRMTELMGGGFGYQAPKLLYAFGPCIGPCCYEVSESLLGEFKWIPDFERAFTRRHDKLYLDLKEMNRRVLEGFNTVEVASLELCTNCRKDLCYSARRDGLTGRNLAIIGLRTAI